MVKHYLDNAGIVLSSVCAVHCIAMPFLITILPVLGFGFLLSESSEFWFTLMVISIAFVSVVLGIKNHRNMRAFLSFVVAVIFLFVAHDFEGTVRIFLHVLGGLFLISTHLLNKYLCNICPSCEQG